MNSLLQLISLIPIHLKSHDIYPFKLNCWFLDWPKISFGFFHNQSMENPNELFGQPNIYITDWRENHNPLQPGSL